MLTPNDRAYYERRAVQERHLAARSPDLIAKAAHLEMARCYELRLDLGITLDEHSRPRREPSLSGLIRREAGHFQVLPPS
jgi:hypothetical protein